MRRNQIVELDALEDTGKRGGGGREGEEILSKRTVKK